MKIKDLMTEEYENKEDNERKINTRCERKKR